jgi:hypothetical protein
MIWGITGIFSRMKMPESLGSPGWSMNWLLDWDENGSGDGMGFFNTYRAPVKYNTMGCVTSPCRGIPKCI